MKGTSESRVREALTRLAEDMPLIVYKPPDDARLWKPADFLVWFPDFRPDWQMDKALVTGSAMIEVKDNPQVNGYPFSDLRPNQRAAIREAARIGLPYWLVIWWRHLKRWTVSDAAKVVAFIDDPRTAPIKSVHWMQLAGNMGVDATSDTLAGTLGAALRGELG